MVLTTATQAEMMTFAASASISEIIQHLYDIRDASVNRTDLEDLFDELEANDIILPPDPEDATLRAWCRRKRPSTA
jgi:hypothetical protein